MAEVVSRPAPRPRAPRWRIVVEFRFAGLYPEGTVIRDRHGNLWRSWRDHEYDTYPMWEPADHEIRRTT